MQTEALEELKSMEIRLGSFAPISLPLDAYFRILYLKFVLHLAFFTWWGD